MREIVITVSTPKLIKQILNSVADSNCYKNKLYTWRNHEYLKWYALHFKGLWSVRFCLGNKYIYIYILIQQGCNKLIKYDSRLFCIVSNKCCSFQVSSFIKEILIKSITISTKMLSCETVKLRNTDNTNIFIEPQFSIEVFLKDHVTLKLL